MKPFLKNLRIDSFGGINNRVIGPFSPGLTVVFGANEAGKSTIASFILGVLFGWETRRGKVNNYKPKSAGREGSLFFKTDKGEVDVFRAEKTFEIIGDDSFAVDVDKETYLVVFNLTSDELSDLKDTADITSKLLTAGSGTGSNPTHSLQQIHDRLSRLTSRSGEYDYSITNLQRRLAEVDEEVAVAKETAENLKAQSQEFFEIEQQHKLLKERLSQQSADKEALSLACEQIVEIETACKEQETTIARLLKDEERVKTEYAVQLRKEYDSLVELSAAEERAIRVRIDGLLTEEGKVQNALILAQNNYNESFAQYEAAVASSEETSAKSKRHQRGIKAGLLVLLPLAFLVAGLPLFVHGKTIESLSFTVAGAGLVFFSALLSLAALAILFRPKKEEENAQNKIQDAQWVMLKDQKKRENCQRQQEDFYAAVKKELDSLGLIDARGSIQEARSILDEAREERQTRAQYRLKEKALISQRKECEDTLVQLNCKRALLLERADLQDETEQATKKLKIALEKKEQACEELLEAAEQLNRRHGELSQILSVARTDMEFNRLKIQREQLKTRLEESKREYVKLLLAKRMLESAIALWESKSQPEVIKQANRLLSIITDGRWVRVEVTPSGNLEVIDSTKMRRAPKHLSLGTCQQLYLALRIALLMTADNVGQAIPLVADDILVNFDTERRKGAARALVELASVRQVILLTCHEEVVEVLREEDPSSNLLRL